MNKLLKYKYMYFETEFFVFFSRPDIAFCQTVMYELQRYLDVLAMLYEKGCYRPYLTQVFGQTGLNKQCRPRSDAAECSI